MTMQKVVHHEGWWALWRGNTINVVRMVPSKCVLLSCSDLYKDAVRDLRLCESTFCVGGLAGAFAGASATFFTYPLDLARTRMAGRVHSTGSGGSWSSHGAVDTLVAIWRQGGVLGLFRGAGPTVIGALPYEGIKFGVYDVLKHSRVEGGGSGSLGPLWHACCGATAAIIAHVVTYPNDVRAPPRTLPLALALDDATSGWTLDSTRTRLDSS